MAHWKAWFSPKHILQIKMSRCKFIKYTYTVLKTCQELHYLSPTESYKVGATILLSMYLLWGMRSNWCQITQVVTRQPLLQVPLPDSRVHALYIFGISLFLIIIHFDLLLKTNKQTYMQKKTLDFFKIGRIFRKIRLHVSQTQRLYFVYLNLLMLPNKHKKTQTCLLKELFL